MGILVIASQSCGYTHTHRKIIHETSQSIWSYFLALVTNPTQTQISSFTNIAGEEAAVPPDASTGGTIYPQLTAPLPITALNAENTNGFYGGCALGFQH